MTDQFRPGPADTGASRHAVSPARATRTRRSLRHDRRGTVALLTAIILPTGLVLAGISLDVSHWAAARLDLQRIADLAALSGAGRYASTTDSATALAAAADAAEVNGLPAGVRVLSEAAGGAVLTDTSSSYTATATMLSGPARVSVDIRRQISTSFSALALAAATQPVTASAVAEVIARTSGGQACVLGLQGYGTDDTSAADITISGGANTVVSLKSCDLRSNGSVAFNGNPAVDVPRIIASGQIDSPPQCGDAEGYNQTESGAPQVPDPFAATYSGALSAMPQTSVAQPAGASLDPPAAGEAYASLSFGGHGSYTLNPGIYYVAGSVTINGGATVSGNGVTLIAAGGITVNGNASVALVAPGTGPTAGLLYAASGSGATISLNGTAAQTLTGALYAPEGDVAVRGNAAVGPGGCLAVVAQTVTIAGSAALDDTGCATLGVPSINDQPGLVRLVQ
jgi:Flp pilus assembly protein TadG